MKEYHAEIGIIGGTGIYNTELLTNAKSIKIFTPYGKTSDLVSIGEYNGRFVAFIPRHGKRQQSHHTRLTAKQIFGL
jgi:5'-methylthioadenosine phosphorylase